MDAAAIPADLTTAFGGLLAVSIALGVYIGWPMRWFSWHPICMMVGFVACGGAAVIAKRKGGRQMTLLHGYGMTAATVLNLAGWYVIWRQKEMLKKPHLTSWHSWTGVAVSVFFCANVLSALVALHPDYGVAKSNTVRAAHRVSSRIGLLLGFITVVSGWIKLANNVFLTVLLVGLLAFLSWEWRLALPLAPRAKPPL